MKNSESIKTKIKILLREERDLWFNEIQRRLLKKYNISVSPKTLSQCLKELLEDEELIRSKKGNMSLFKLNKEGEYDE